jgi:hypothetical protein
MFLVGLGLKLKKEMLGKHNLVTVPGLECGTKADVKDILKPQLEESQRKKFLLKLSKERTQLKEHLTKPVQEKETFEESLKKATR